MVRKILVVDDDPKQIALVRRILEPALGVLVDAVTDGAAFARRLVEGDFVLAITEVDLSWGDGLAAIEAIKAVDRDRPIVLLTERADLERLGGAVALGLSALVPKSASGYAGLASVVGDLIGTDASQASPSDPVEADELPIGMFVLSSDDVVLEASYGLARAFGFRSARELIGRSLTDFFAESADRVRWRTLVTARRNTRDWEAPIVWDSGERRWVRVVAQWSTEGQRSVCRGAVEDISEYKRIEESFAEQAEALKRSNEELRDYARLVSHDLQEPLQVITRYSRMLGEIEDDSKADRYLEHVVTSAERMQEMVDGILAYSKVEAEGRPPSTVDLNKVVKEARGNLAAAIEDSGADLEIGELPVVVGHRSQLTRLFQNLLGNAIKFRVADESPRVVVVASDDGSDWTISVRDHGIGIDPADRERVFAMGQRLHPASRYPGSGIGLAICRRIAHHHGGELQIVPVDGRGSCFEVRLPKHGSAEQPTRARGVEDRG